MVGGRVCAAVAERKREYRSLFIMRRIVRCSKGLARAVVALPSGAQRVSGLAVLFDLAIPVLSAPRGATLQPTVGERL
jgi:hypothetical protein